MLHNDSQLLIKLLENNLQSIELLASSSSFDSTKATREENDFIEFLQQRILHAFLNFNTHKMPLNTSYLLSAPALLNIALAIADTTIIDWAKELKVSDQDILAVQNGSKVDERLKKEINSFISTNFIKLNIHNQLSYRK